MLLQICAGFHQVLDTIQIKADESPQQAASPWILGGLDEFSGAPKIIQLKFIRQFLLNPFNFFFSGSSAY